LKNIIKLIFLLLLTVTFGFSKGEVSRIFAHKEAATSTIYTANGHQHKWGGGDNLVIDAFEYNGKKYNYVSDAPLIKIRRVDNANASGEPCGLFAEKFNGSNYHLAASFPNNNGNCDMAKVMGGRTINVGALDLFRNVGYTAKNIERVDFISPQGITAPTQINHLSKSGHVVTEKQGNNYLQIAAILSIDANNNPTSFGPLVMIHKHYDSTTEVRYGLTNIYLPDNSSIYNQDLGFYVDNTSVNQGKPWWIQTSSEPLGMAFVTLEDLGVSAGQTYYGFAYFGRDVTTQNHTLTDVSTFPKDTGGDTADPYGGVASYFVDEELLYDFGDAPNSYPHVSHKISPNLYLGDNAPDSENNQQSSLDASGDGADDNDSVLTLPTLSLNAKTYSVEAKVFNNSGQEAYITAWIDFNKNGKFEFNEALNTNNLSVPSSSAPQTVNLVWDDTFSPNQFANLTAGTTIMRIRLSTSRVLRCDSEQYSDGGSYANNYFISPNGEVEDYAIDIAPSIQGTRGSFNIQRSNALLNTNDFNLYTQIVGRDFNYHVVFYEEDFSVEKELSNVPVKIDLVNADTREVLHTNYAYFSPTLPSTRVPMLENHDLDTLPATKEALFLITYATNSDGTVKQEPCTSPTAKACFETLMSIADGNKTTEAKDTFAIRPERFYVSLKDQTVERVNSDYPTPTINLASGYEYNLTIMATEHNKQTPSKGYHSSFTEQFDFNMSGLTSCRNTSAIEENITFTDGLHNNISFIHDEAGQYSLTLQKDSNWTTIDQSSHDCIANSSQTSVDGNSKSGCDIALAITPIKLNFYPHHFDVDLTMQNLPNSTHDDFIYMSELNSSYHEVAIGFDGKITAKNEQNGTTENFTASCMATNLLLDLNASSISVEGNNTQIRTVAGTDINFTRYVQFNQETPNVTDELNENLTRISNTLTINRDKFLNENNGTLTLDMRYNLNKHPSEPINPVEVTFREMNVADINTQLVAHSIENHLAKGEETFVNNRKNFYFAIVVSDLDNYPEINMNVSPLVRTPLNVDIYCKTALINYCEDRGILSNTNLSSSTREQNGWYLSSKHNGDLDGNVTSLVANPPIVNISPAPPIALPNGENGLVSKTFIDCSSPSSTITIGTSPVLAFSPSQYVVNCTDTDPSQWTGIGKAGNVLSIKPKVNDAKKMDW